MWVMANIRRPVRYYKYMIKSEYNPASWHHIYLSNVSDKQLKYINVRAQHYLPVFLLVMINVCLPKSLLRTGNTVTL